mmetsp:Transcript_164237/g.522310  ORF Transcript_164237/g.522310 Transcript_164237/m.522310 type:complete len:218 (-) Transcript_164237:32-685(-)
MLPQCHDIFPPLHTCAGTSPGILVTARCWPPATSATVPPAAQRSRFRTEPADPGRTPRAAPSNAPSRPRPTGSPAGGAAARLPKGPPRRRNWCRSASPAMLRQLQPATAAGAAAGAAAAAAPVAVQADPAAWAAALRQEYPSGTHATCAPRNPYRPPTAEHLQRPLGAPIQHLWCRTAACPATDWPMDGQLLEDRQGTCPCWHEGHSLKEQSGITWG